MRRGKRENKGLSLVILPITWNVSLALIYYPRQKWGNERNREVEWDRGDETKDDVPSGGTSRREEKTRPGQRKISFLSGPSGARATISGRLSLPVDHSVKR